MQRGRRENENGKLPVDRRRADFAAANCTPSRPPPTEVIQKAKAVLAWIKSDLRRDESPPPESVLKKAEAVLAWIKAPPEKGEG